MTPPESTAVLRWIFLRDAMALSCELRSHGSAYDVCLVPHWDIQASAVESCEGAVSALRRHAELARALRTAGWQLVRDVPWNRLADYQIDAA